jgi:hypothetical protein
LDSRYARANRQLRPILSISRWTTSCSSVARGNAPCCQGLARPNGARLPNLPVAHRKYKMDVRRIRLAEFIPTLASEPLNRHSATGNLFECMGTDTASGMAPGAVAGEVRKSFPIHDGFGHDGAGGVPDAQEQNIEVPRCHVVVTFLDISGGRTVRQLSAAAGSAAARRLGGP